MLKIGAESVAERRVDEVITTVRPLDDHGAGVMRPKNVVATAPNQRIDALLGPLANQHEVGGE